MKHRSKKKKKNQVKKKKSTGAFSFPWLPFFTGFFVLSADQLSKYFVHTKIPLMTHEAQWYPYNGIEVFENFLGIECSLVHAVNYGAAWGMFSDFQVPLLVLRILFIMGLSIYAIAFNKVKAFTIPLTLVIAGAVGNIIDYFVYGHVVDMIHFVFWGYDYPVFNIADSSIFIGVASLMLLSWSQDQKSLVSSR